MGHKPTLEPITEPGKKEDSNWPARIMAPCPEMGIEPSWLTFVVVVIKKKKKKISSLKLIFDQPL